MRDSLKEWRNTTDISVNQIYNLVCEAAEKYVDVDTVYLSPDLFYKLFKEMADVVGFAAGFAARTGCNYISIMTVIGSIRVKAVPGLINFCHVGNESTYKKLEWIKINETFEKEILFGEE